METLHLLALSSGLGFLAGVRLYGTVLALGLSIRMGWLELPAEWQRLEALADWRVLSFAAAGFLIEFFADKIPWVDSLWDSFHTFIRPAGAGGIAWGGLEGLPPEARSGLALLAGGTALASHAAKAATRLAVNQSPEPFSNVGLSLAGDLAVPLGLWFVIEYPLVAGGIVAGFLLLFALISPFVFRLLRLQITALAGAARSWLNNQAGGPPQWTPAESASSRLAAIERALEGSAAALPPPYGRFLERRFGVTGTPPLCRAAATKGLRGYGNSVGYLCFSGDNVMFVCRRWFRVRAAVFPKREIQGVEVSSGLFANRLILQRGGKTYRFAFFKDAFLPAASPAPAAASP